MGLVSIFERGGDDYHEYKKHLKMAKKAIEALCELTEDMEDEYGISERGGYRGGYRDDMEERGGRVSMRRR
ncbi:MAG: hypothetical protein II661_04925 [Bacteroidales bacterium]|nr:hypothetical protein [Bacteroidales bacterium]